MVLNLILFAFFFVLIVCAPLLNAQAALLPPFSGSPALYYFQVQDRFGDYLVSEHPFFFVRLVWHELFFIWPLANAYAMLARRSWFNTTCLILGSSLLTSMPALPGHLGLYNRLKKTNCLIKCLNYIHFVVLQGATLINNDLERNGVSTEESIYEITYHGKGRMPGFGEKCMPRGQYTFGPRLQDVEIKLLAMFVKSQAEQGWPNIEIYKY